MNVQRDAISALCWRCTTAEMKEPKMPVRAEGDDMAKKKRKKKVEGEGEAASRARSSFEGTLTKTYKGTEYKATMLQSGKVSVNGEHYDSLTAAACAITKQKISGPAFFGLWVPPKAAKKKK